MKYIGALLFAFFASCSFGGQITSLDPTPQELIEVGVTHEKMGFTFEEPVSARFWVEYEDGDKKIQTMEVPREKAAPMRKYTLIYVQTSNDQVSLTAVTDSEFPLNRRSCTLGAGDGNGSRRVACSLSSLDVPLGKDITLYTATIKAGYRNFSTPDKVFKIKARFEAK